ncbi:hypothetical protein INT82_04930 [Mannheimia haemolytica]|nr:hypothetical protein [Mannheimia haemolytica]
MDVSWIVTYSRQPKRIGTRHIRARFNDLSRSRSGDWFRRARGRGELDRIEQQSLDFFYRTRERYLELTQHNDKAVIINARTTHRTGDCGYSTSN